MVTVDVKYCTCEHPNGFKFVEYGEAHQVWEHVRCGGIVVKPLVKTWRTEVVIVE